MARISNLVAVGVFFLGVLFSSAAKSDALLELKVKGQAYQGRLVAHDDDVCWLMDRDGQLHRLDVHQVGEHRSISSEFRRLSDGDVRDHLRREFGREYEIAGTSHFLVCAAKGRADAYAPVFEEIYRSFHRYLSARGLKVQQPEFPLVGIVFSDHRSFASYARTEGVAAAQGLMGYYLPTSNRVALFDDAAKGQQASTNGDRSARLAGPASLFVPSGRTSRGKVDFPPALADVAWHGNIRANLEDTIVHETTHQVAFNSGLHSRIADNPLWVVEGLATVFESPGVRDPQGTTPQMRINRERFVWFGNYAKTRRKPKSLAAFVSSDAPFNASPLDAYSQAWALTFFLLETRSAEYSRYLKLLINHDPMKSYAPDDRLSDFKKAFGNDLNSLDAQLERFIERLN